MQIEVEQKSDDQLIAIGVFSWPVWTKEVSIFPHTYEDIERCYMLDGEVEVDAYGEKVRFGKGDFVTFPVGMTCTWNVLKPVRKHYQLG